MSNKIYTWNDLAKIGPPEKWIQMYHEYTDMLTKEDVAAWWAGQYEMANKERCELKIKLKTYETNNN